MSGERIEHSIGPAGQPPVTTYTYESGAVTLTARPAVQHTVAELTTVVRRIDLFTRAVMAGDPPGPTALNTPMDFRVRKNNAASVACDFRSGTLNLDVSIDVVTRVVSFDARPKRTVAWSDFELFARWMAFVLEVAQRQTL